MRIRWLADASQDIRYTLRTWRKSPGFASVAIVTLGVGIGAATVIYSVVDTVLLRPLPLPDGDRLVQIVEHERPRTLQQLNLRELHEWRARTATLEGLSGWTLDPQFTVRTSAGMVRMTAGKVVENYFEVLGIRAALGRTIEPDDDRNADVAVLSHAGWRKHFGGDPAAIGSVLEAQSVKRTMTIVGVLPEGSEHLGTPVDIYVPYIIPPGGRPPLIMSAIGRLREHVSLTTASEEANIIGNAIRPPRPHSEPPLSRPRFEAVDLKDALVGDARPVLRMFLAAVAVVMLIVCANVANLLLARGMARRREMALRLAVGASRGRIVRQLLAECLMLAFTGGVLGAALGAAGVTTVKELAIVEAEGVFRVVFGASLLPRVSEVTVDVRLLGIATAIAAFTSILFGLLPAVHVARTAHLHSPGRRTGGTDREESRVRSVLVVAQLALATVLLVAAGLLATSFVSLATVEKGYDPENALAFQLVVPPEYPSGRKAETIEAVLARVRAIPEVSAAGFAYAGILIGVQDTVGAFVPEGHAVEGITKQADRPRLKSLSRGYFEAVGAKLLDGRLFRDNDTATSPAVVVINRTVARRYFGARSPVGSYMDWHFGKEPALRVEIIGVVDDIRQGTLAREPYGEIFMDYRQLIAAQRRWGTESAPIDRLAFGFMSFAARTRGQPADALPAVRRAVRAADQNAAIDAIAPMETLVGNSIARQRFHAVVLAVFAAVAALLAAVGVYGLLAYAVVQRTQEIGIRMALGADRRRVLALVLRRGMVLTLVGIALGLGGAVAGTRYVQSMLYGVTPLDPATFTMVAAAFATLAAIASYVPARRATQVDPMVALRSE